MSSPIQTPSGGGAQSGLGEKFSPDLFTGTGNFTVPIALPPGRNGFQPQLSLGYSTGNGNSAFGFGWGLGVPGVSRKTAKGVPKYDNEKDTFVLSGAEDLIPVERITPGVTRYQPRTEGLFASICHFLDNENDYWKVKSKDGLVSWYGTPASKGNDPALVTDPDNKSKVFSWKLTRTEDTLGNHILYEYERDQIQDDTYHHWDQNYLKTIRYVDYDDSGTTKYLIRIAVVYENRPDPFSDYKPGFEERTVKRCKEINIYTNPGGEILTRTYHFQYSDERLAAEDQPHNGASLLCRIEVEGHDQANSDPNKRSEFLPPLDFRYTHFKPKEQKFSRLEGDSLPLASLANPGFEMIDLFGNGLPDIVEINGVVRYWRNLGDGKFDLPRLMKDAPAGITLADPNVQLLDANGDGRTDLLVNSDKIAGYYSTKFGASWDTKAFKKYKQAPSFNLADPEVKLIDLDGDGVTDALRSGSAFECFFNDKNDGWVETRRVPRKQLSNFPNLNFSDPRVKWADMNGDGLQDIVVVHSGNITYWPSMGYGNFGKPVTMKNSPRFPVNYDPARIQLGDIDGDGQADIIYIDADKVTFWINKSGNAWSEPIEILGTPFVTNINGIRIADVYGSGINGVLYSFDGLSNTQRHRWYYLDLTGGIKPYLLHEMDNNMGALTRTHYLPSTRYYLADQYGMSPFDEQRRRVYKNRKPWKTRLPFPVQVVSRVEVIDKLSVGKLTTEYLYHHGYWDGGEREFRGFGRVDQKDTETFERYNSSGLHNATPLVPEAAGGNSLPVPGAVQSNNGSSFTTVAFQHYASPTEVRNWFHLGPVGDEFGDWMEADFSSEYWSEDPTVLQRDADTVNLVKALPRRAKRDAYRAWRGSSLRTELYALDASGENGDYVPGANGRPYTITESQYGIRLEAAPVSNTLATSAGLGSGVALRIPKETSGYIFFSFATASRTTQWERGHDPMTQFSFTADFDVFGQPRKQLAVALPRGIKPPYDSGTTSVPAEDGGGPLLSTLSTTTYAQSTNPDIHMVNRVCRTIGYEVIQQGTENVFQLRSRVLQAALPTEVGNTQFKIIGCSFNYYDGDPFIGEGYGVLGDQGALVKSETLILTSSILSAAYGSIPIFFDNPTDLAYPADADLSGAGYPTGFINAIQNDDNRLGYRYHANSGNPNYPTGWYATGSKTKFDFQVPGAIEPRGLVIETQDVFNSKATVTYDAYKLLPVSAKQYLDVTNYLETVAEYDYRVLQASMITDPNENRAVFGFSPLGLLKQSGAIGKFGMNEGDIKDESPFEYVPSVRMEYDFFAFMNYGDPVWVKTIQSERHWQPLQVESPTIVKVEYTDGFGRLLQTRAQAEDVIFGDQTFGDSGLPADQTLNAHAVGVERGGSDPLNVVVSGWKIYNNKGKVVEQYEPFFDKGFDYQPPFTGAIQHVSLINGKKVRMFYDPRGQVVRTINPDGSEQWVIIGKPQNNSAVKLGSTGLPEISPPPPVNQSLWQWGLTPWESYSYDANDLAPLTHSLGSGVPAEHHYTPKSAQVDALGRTIKTIDRLGQSTVDEVMMRYKFDIRGNLLEVKDALATPRIVFTHEYDLKPKAGEDDPGANVLKTIHLDGGTKRSLFDASFKPVELTDQKLARVLSSYDVLSRPIKMWAKDNNVDPFSQRQKVLYGDSAGLTNPHLLNLKGKPYRSYDEAGMTEIELYDFKGNALTKTRQVIADDDIIAVFSPPPVDWNVAPHRVDWEGTPTLEGNYTTETIYDALNRAQQVIYPEDTASKTKVLLPTYNRAGALEKIELKDDVGASAVTYVEHIAYNAKGQRLLMALGNGVMTRYAYDEQTFRLARLKSETYTRSTNTFTYTGSTKQDFKYSYDLIGNIVSIRDKSPAAVEGPDDLERVFEYDALYRLLKGTGRECDVPGSNPSWDENLRCYDPTMTRTYRREYTYDKMGNILRLIHKDTEDGTNDFTRIFNPDVGGNMPTDYGASNLLNKVKIGSNNYLFEYDANGNQTKENSNRYSEWDYADRMRVFYNKATPTSEPSVYTHYLYDATGNRVKKITRKDNGTHPFEVTIYIDGIFEHIYKYDGSSRTDEKNEIHVMDDKSRIAMKWVGYDDGTPEIKYILDDHLGSSTLIMQAGGAYYRREEYFPFGETSFGGFSKKRYRYCGKEKDEESGLYYYGARYYLAWVCRFVSVDPIAKSYPHLTCYQYASNSPVGLIDIDGLEGGAPPTLSPPVVRPRQVVNPRIWETLPPPSPGGELPLPPLGPQVPLIAPNPQKGENFYVDNNGHTYPIVDFLDYALNTPSYKEVNEAIAKILKLTPQEKLIYYKNLNDSLLKPELTIKLQSRQEEIEENMRRVMSNRPIASPQTDTEEKESKTNVLYRFDTRSPEQIKAQGGFRAYGKNYDLMLHAHGDSIWDQTSGYIGTSKSLSALQKTMEPGIPGYIYVIKDQPYPKGRDVNAELGWKSPHPEEEEIAVRDFIPQADIIGSMPYTKP